MDFVQEAISMMNTRYLPGIEKLLDKQDACGTVTVTLNKDELRVLKMLVNDQINSCHNDWYNVTHDVESYEAGGPVIDMAYDLATVEKSTRFYQKLHGKLENA